MQDEKVKVEASCISGFTTIEHLSLWHGTRCPRMEMFIPPSTQSKLQQNAKKHQGQSDHSCHSLPVAQEIKKWPRKRSGKQRSWTVELRIVSSLETGKWVKSLLVVLSCFVLFKSKQRGPQGWERNESLQCAFPFLLLPSKSGFQNLFLGQLWGPPNLPRRFKQPFLQPILNSTARAVFPIHSTDMLSHAQNPSPGPINTRLVLPSIQNAFYILILEAPDQFLLLPRSSSSWVLGWNREFPLTGEFQEEWLKYMLRNLYWFSMFYWIKKKKKKLRLTVNTIYNIYSPRFPSYYSTLPGLIPC